MLNLCLKQTSHALVAAIVCATTLSSHAALAPNEAIEYVYRGNNLDHWEISGPGGSYSADVDGIDFSFFTLDYIQAGQTVQLTHANGSFTGVMGSGDQFSTWNFAWYGGADFTSIKANAWAEDRIRNWPHTTTYNTDKPGVWEVRLVTMGAQHPPYGVAAPLGQQTLVPEPSSHVMALLGLAVMGALVRRKATAPAPARTA
jgi:PEP-CTERM motif